MMTPRNKDEAVYIAKRLLREFLLTGRRDKKLVLLDDGYRVDFEWYRVFLDNDGVVENTTRR